MCLFKMEEHGRTAVARVPLLGWSAERCGQEAIIYATERSAHGATTFWCESATPRDDAGGDRGGEFATEGAVRPDSGGSHGGEGPFGNAHRSFFRVEGSHPLDRRGGRAACFVPCDAGLGYS